MFGFQVITLFPEMIEAAMNGGVFSQAVKKNLLSLSTINPRDFSSDVHRTVDDRPFGGGDGMIMLIEPLLASIAQARENISKLSPKATEKSKVIYLSPQGVPLTHEKARALSSEAAVILLCGRYGGIDQRLLNEAVDEEISIGDYVLSGGELAACVVMDAVSRFIPGVLGHAQSAEKDSFGNGLLEAPSFTRPRVYGSAEDHPVPETLLSGNHKAIDAWKESVGVIVTLKKRPDLLLVHPNAEALIASAKKIWPSLNSVEKRELGLAAFDFEAKVHELSLLRGGWNG